MNRTRSLPIALLLLLFACGSNRASEPSSQAAAEDPSGEAAPLAPAEPTPAAAPEPQTTVETPMPSAAESPVVRIDTSMGLIRVKLDKTNAPRTVANFLRYVSESFYDGTIFHRVIDDFMVQGGGFSTGMVRKTTHDPIPLEISPRLRHVDGAIAMARTSDPNSATAQFYLCDGAQAFLDDNYAPFGVIVEGMDVMRAIAATPTGPGDVPRAEVTIRSIRAE